MNGVGYEVKISGDAYTPAQIEAMRFEREKHVLQELVHYGAPVRKDGRALSFDGVNYLTRDEAPRILLQAKQAMNADATRDAYREALDASDAFWRDAVARWNPEDGYREAFAEVSIRGMEFSEYMGVLKALMGKGEDVALGEEPEHFCASELEGLADNEKASVETMGMFGGPVASIVRIDPTLVVPVEEADGSKNMIVGTSRLLDGTERNDAAIHQFRPVEGGLRSASLRRISLHGASGDGRRPQRSPCIGVFWAALKAPCVFARSMRRRQARAILTSRMTWHLWAWLPGR